MAKIIKKWKFIICDECTLTHKHALESVDRLLKDLMNTDKIMGSISLLLSGDFRQILPVVKKGNKADHINIERKENN